MALRVAISEVPPRPLDVAEERARNARSHYRILSRTGVPYGRKHVGERSPEIADPSNSAASWRPWRVAPGSGFEVCDPSGEVGLIQIDKKQFLVTKPFRFSDAALEKMLTDRLVRDGQSAADAQRAVEDARTFTPTTENPTDLASIPLFMRWFENSYGVHSLAAIIHDELIVNEPNSGALGSDTLSDRFFREMMRSAGVPWLKRWIMWAAVAIRSRWAAGGVRRLSVLVWIVLAVTGIGSFACAAGSALLGWGRPVDIWLLLVIALLLPFASAPLWGKQYGASLVAAVAAFWILPAAAFGVVGYIVYRSLELLAEKSGLE